MFSRASIRFLRGLFYAALPPTIDYLASYLGGNPLFGAYTPLVVALLLAADKLIRDMRHAEPADLG